MSQLARLRSKMVEGGIPAMLVSHIENVSWLTGFSGTYGRVLVSPTEARFLTDSRYAIQAAEQVAEMPVSTFKSPVDGDDFTLEHIRDMGFEAIGFEAANVTYATWEKWAQRFQGVRLLPAADVFGALRMVKTEEEIAHVRDACRIADAAFEHIVRMIQPGVSEYDINLDLEFFIKRQGAALAFEPIVVSGERSARPHGRASDRVLRRGDFLTLDFGATVNGYHSDITRTVVVGEATDRHREIYQAVLDAQLAALDAIKPGVAAKDVDRLSRQVMGDLAAHFGHGLGHGLGRIVHDSGRMNATSTDVFEPGQIWTVEPGIYIEGFGGVRIEDDVVVTEAGIEVLTHAPKEMLVLPRA